jgi:hypothetical protein
LRIIEDVEEFGGGVDEGFCAGGEKFVGGAVSPEAADGEHTAGCGGKHIDIGVTDVEELLRGDFEMICDSQSKVGMGF